MIAIEIETAIVDHSVNFRSDLLPASAGKARVIVMYEPTSVERPVSDVLAYAHAAQMSFPKRTAEQLSADMAALRGEWDRPL